MCFTLNLKEGTKPSTLNAEQGKELEAEQQRSFLVKNFVVYESLSLSLSLARALSLSRTHTHSLSHAARTGTPPQAREESRGTAADAGVEK